MEKEESLRSLPRSDSSNDIEQNKNQFSGRRKKIILISTWLLYMASFCAFSTISPFYTLEALKKGSTKTISGAVFSAYPLVIFFVSPIVGKYLTVIGPVFVLLTGSFLEAGCEILFGFIDRMPSMMTFVVFSFLIRILTAVGSGFSQTAILAIISMIYKENLSFVFGLFEVSSGIGLMVGPSIGGVLYDAGGFYLPFVVIGGLMMLLLVLVKFSIPSGLLDSTPAEDTKLAPIGKTFQIPGMILMMVTIIYTGIAISFYDSTLAVHLTTITNGKISKSEIGLFFLCATGSYTVGAPLFGYLADTKLSSGSSILIGHLLSFVAYLFIGPAPFLETYIKPSLWLVGVFVALSGFADAPILVPSIRHMQSIVEKAGLIVDEPMISLISGIYTGCFNIGFAIGPLFGGLMIEYSSFQLATFIISIGYIILSVVHFLFLYCPCLDKQRKGNSEIEKEEGSNADMLSNPHTSPDDLISTVNT